MSLMKTTLFFTFLFSITKASLLVCIGILIKNHFNKIMSFIGNKSIENKTDSEDEKFTKLIYWIGIIIILIGLFYGIQSLMTWIISLQIPNTIRPMLFNK
jgi:hypothetical protein